MNARITTTPWAIFPPAARDAIGRFRACDPAAIGMSDFFTQRRPVQIESGVARIHVYGPLVDDAPPVAGLLGMTDYRVLASEIRTAVDAGASQIVLDIDSPGGMVSGLAEVVAELDAAPVVKIAECRGMACSAAYWLACACDRINATPSTILGSIGCVRVWEDTTDLDARLGITINVITNEGADLKGAGMGSTLTEPQIQFMQDWLNKIGADFRAYVEGNRPDIDDEVFRAGHYYGQECLDLGLCDAIRI